MQKFIALTLLIFSIPAVASGFAHTYEDVQRLKQESPVIAAAYLKGLAEGVFSFRAVETGVYTYCPPRGTKVDSELIELMATNEVRLHGADSSDWYHSLVNTGIKRAFPCEK